MERDFFNKHNCNMNIYLSGVSSAVPAMTVAGQSSWDGTRRCSPIVYWGSFPKWRHNAAKYFSLRLLLCFMLHLYSISICFAVRNLGLAPSLILTPAIACRSCGSGGSGTGIGLVPCELFGVRSYGFPIGLAYVAGLRIALSHVRTY